MSDGDPRPLGDAVRFTDVLTTGAAVADYQGESVVAAVHLIAALDILMGRRTMAELGRPVSPLVPRQKGGAVDDAVRGVVQEWFMRLESDVAATLAGSQLEQFRSELQKLVQPT